MAIVLGIDIGGSHITAALVDLQTKSVVAGSLKRKLVNAQAGLNEIIADWCKVIHEVYSISSSPVLQIGIAMPGPFDYEEGISFIKDQDKFQALYNKNIKRILSAQLEVASENIRFMNDAASFLQGEAFCGAAKNNSRVLGLTLGTGLGSAICIDGMASDADLWKSPFKEGIAEDYLSTRWFVKHYSALTGRSVKGVKEMMEEGMPLPLQNVFEDFSANLALFLQPLVVTYDVEAVVLGGNIANAFPSFHPSLKKYLTYKGVTVDVSLAQLGENASLIGAASCWQEQVYAKVAAPISV